MKAPTLLDLLHAPSPSDSITLCSAFGEMK